MVSAPQVQQLGPSVLLQGPVNLELARVLVASFRTQHRDGIGPSAALRDALAALLAAAEHPRQASSGTAEARNSADSSGSYQDEIGTQEAAVMMQCSTEWVRRLAREGRLGQSRVVRGCRVVSRAEVTAYLDNQVSA